MDLPTFTVPQQAFILLNSDAIFRRIPLCRPAGDGPEAKGSRAYNQTHGINRSNRALDAQWAEWDARCREFDGVWGRHVGPGQKWRWYDCQWEALGEVLRQRGWWMETDPSRFNEVFGTSWSPEEFEVRWKRMLALD